MRHIRRRPDDESRATAVELLFDLVFVFVVTQLADLLSTDLSPRGAARTAVLLLAAWWSWIYTTWATNWFDADTLVVRALLLAGMVAGMVGAISIPQAFGGRAWLFVVGYIAIQALRSLFVVVVTHRDDPLYRPVQRILGWTCVGVPLWSVGALAHGDTRLAIWAFAVVVDYTGPLVGHWLPGLGRSRPRDWQIEPAHFVERLEQFLIIALGELIVSAGTAASALHLTTARLAAMVVAVLIAVVLWWLYFDVHAGLTLERLRAAEDERGRQGRALSYLYILLVAGIIVVAVGSALVVEHPGRVLHGGELTALAAGPILYLLGSVALKARVLDAPWQRRLAAAAAIALVVVAGAGLPALALWTLTFAALSVLAGSEAVTTRRGRA